MDRSSFLGQSRLSVITRHADHELAQIQDLIEHKMLVDGRSELEELLGQLLAVQPFAPQVSRTLDLIGHSTPGDSLLMLGDWVIDAGRTSVTAFFNGLADNDVLFRLGIRGVRLLGCQTADTERGRATICKLAEILQIEVSGSSQMLYSAHYESTGFKSECSHVLVSSSDLRGKPRHPAAGFAGEPYPRVLDIEMLPSTPLIIRDHPWPRRIATRELAGNILRLVRRSDGAQMPGLLAAPSCEVALPSTKPNWYHLMQILLDGKFVRVYPDGDRKPGVVFAVDDPHALRSLVDNLPTS